MDTDALQRLQSNVRSYSRSFPAVFDRAKGALLFDAAGRRYVDFFAGAGALNYGHNDDLIKHEVMTYLQADGVVQALDMDTCAKARMLGRFESVILRPRKLDYRVQFTGPGGSDAVEAALKLARKVTGRRDVIAFMGSFHGMTLGSLAVTSPRRFKGIPGVGATDVAFVPYAQGAPGCDDTIAYLDHLVRNDSSGVGKPAAILVETVQAEGGVHVAPVEWLRRLRALCDEHQILLICDDIQAGCGRVGSFFSFERAGIVPDIVTLSKSLSGLGLPLSAVLMRPALDIWEPGEHTGTFRAHPLALVGAHAALHYWETSAFQEGILRRAEEIRAFLMRLSEDLGSRARTRGLGMMWGIDVGSTELAKLASRACFEEGVIVETVGPRNEVLKILPPLSISEDQLLEGLSAVRGVLLRVLAEVR